VFLGWPAGYVLRGRLRLIPFGRFLGTDENSRWARFERGSNLSGRDRFAQRSTAERLQRRLRFTSASGGGKSSRSMYRQAVRRPTSSISAIAGTSTKSSGATVARLTVEADIVRAKQ
jgi:hypothetical protein